MIILYIILGTLAGFFSGLIGLSPGCFLTPILIIALNTPYDNAVNASLMVVFFTSLLSYLKNRRNIPIETCIAIGIPSAVFAFIGDVFLRHFIFPPLLLEFLVAGIMFLGADLSRLSIRSDNNPTESKQASDLFYSLLGAFSGLTVSMLAVSGSVFITPLITVRKMAKYTDAIKIASISAMIASLFSLTSEIFQQTLPISMAFFLIIGALTGSFLGGIANKYTKIEIMVQFNYWIFIILGYSVFIRLIYNSL